MELPADSETLAAWLYQRAGDLAIEAWRHSQDHGTDNLSRRLARDAVALAREAARLEGLNGTPRG